MRKMKTTRKAVMAEFPRVYEVGYCRLQSLFSCTEPSFYTCGTYGWNADVYSFGDTAIVTGYRPFGKPVPSGVEEKYESRAREIMEEYGWQYEECKARMNDLIAEFLEDVQKIK